MAKTDVKTYLPARLVKGHRWYIVFYQLNPYTGERERIRETRDLNRIPDLNQRQQQADLILYQINARLPFGYFFEDGFRTEPPYTNILEALEIVKNAKGQHARARTRETIQSHISVFTEFLLQREWTDMSIGEFSQPHAQAFLDYVVYHRGVGHQTYNNYLQRGKEIFNELALRRFVAENPYAGFKKKKLHGKIRRAFNQEEREQMIRRVAHENRWLLLAILFQYYCFIRPIELTRLRFGMISLKEGLIRMPAKITKNRENAIVTIPDAFQKILERFQLQRWDQSWLIFGKMGRPHPLQAVGLKTLGTQHRRFLRKLYDEGMLENIQGLSFYSWKDTGVLELFKRKVDVLEIMKQLRHKDLATTQTYCQSLYSINKEIKALDNNLLGDDLMEELV